MKAKRKLPSLFKLAAQNKSYRSAKLAKERAELRAKKAWKKSMVAAKKKLRAINRKRK